MTIELTRILPDDALSQFRVRDMRPDEVITVSCDSVAEFNNSRRTANLTKDSACRPDGYLYKVESSSSKNTIKISLYESKKEEVKL